MVSAVIWSQSKEWYCNGETDWVAMSLEADAQPPSAKLMQVNAAVTCLVVMIMSCGCERICNCLCKCLQSSYTYLVLHRIAGQAQQWPVWVFWGVSIPCDCACAGVLAGWRVCRRTHPQRGLTRRGCPSAAPQARSEFHGAPRKCPGAGVPQRCALGSQSWGRFSFGYVSLAKQRKVPRPPGRDPAPAFSKEPASAKLPPLATAKAIRQNLPQYQN